MTVEINGSSPSDLAAVRDALGIVELTPKMFGGDNNNAALDDAAWIKLLAAAHTMMLPIRLSGGKTNKITAPFTVDPTKTRIVGDAQATLDFSGAASGNMITLAFGNSRYPTAAAIEGVRFVGVTGQNLFYIGGSGGVGSNNLQGKFLTIRDCFISGFSSHYSFGDNAFLLKIINVQHFGFSGTSISYSANPAYNSGENVLFESCYWGGIAATYPNAMVFAVDGGYLTFSECSFDYLPKIGVQGLNNTRSTVRIIGGHWEFDFAAGGGAMATSGLGGLIDHYCGDLTIKLGGMVLGGGILKCPIQMGNVGNSTGNLHFEAEHVVFTSGWIAVANIARGFVERVANTFSTLTIGRVNVDAQPSTTRFVFPLRGNGLLPATAGGWTLTTSGAAGALSSMTDATVASRHPNGLANYLHITQPFGGTATVKSPIISASYMSRFLAELDWRLPTLSTGTATIAFAIYDTAGQFIANVPNSLSLTQANVTSTWTRLQLIVKALLSSMQMSIGSIQCIITLANTAGSGADAVLDVSIPCLQRT